MDSFLFPESRRPVPSIILFTVQIVNSCIDLRAFSGKKDPFELSSAEGISYMDCTAEKENDQSIVEKKIKNLMTMVLSQLQPIKTKIKERLKSCLST